MADGVQVCDTDHYRPTPAGLSLVMLGTTSLDALVFACWPCAQRILEESLDDPDVEGWEVRRLPDAPRASRPEHELLLKLTDGGIDFEVRCLANPDDRQRACTYYAVGVYPATTGPECFVVETARQLTLDEALGQFDPVDLAPVPITWHHEHDGGDDWAAIAPVPGA